MVSGTSASLPSGGVH
ncbi:hypothetical protein E2C01_099294 [Portunus trituberculatus]|uniref:Uncharacterized protein n=1 Tax=Portunus trituberculatus TaxID=210409 RepID=A0A5B7JZZ7_PORTR|nr:hypothetical protein [Portunus trituberculatus]